MTVAITVVIPCRNEAVGLRGCLDALARQDRPRDAFEVIVVEGGSSDGSGDVARAWGARVLHDDGHGPGGARNVGIRAARGHIVAFTDSDCRPQPDWLTRIAEVLAEDPGAHGVAGALRHERGTFLARFEDDETRAYYRGYITSNVAYRRDVLMAVGGFDASLECCEDYDLAWRVLDAGYRIVRDPRPVVLHDPPELQASIPGYLRKQWWYAKSDVPAHARAVRRFVRARRAPGSSQGALAMLPIASDVLHLASLGLAATRRSPRMAATTLAAMLATSTFHAARGARGAKAEVPARVALLMARRLVRAAGTVAGVAALATPHGMRTLSAPALGPLRAPAPPAAPSARAAA